MVFWGVPLGRVFRSGVNYVSKCDKLPHHILTTISIYDKLLKVYNLYGIYKILAKYRKISGSINRDIYIYVPEVKITAYFMVKHRNSHLNCLKLRYVIAHAKESLYPNI
jgi:hypothetical protein